MAYRRKQGMSRASTFKEEVHYPRDDHQNNTTSSSSSSPAAANTSSSSSSSLAAQAIRASSAHRDSSLSSAYRESAFAFRDSDRQKSFPVRSTDAPSYEYTSMKSLNESKSSFWGVLAKKAKQVLEDDNLAQQHNKPGKAGNQMLDIPSDNVFHQSHQSPESSRKIENPSLQKRFDALTSSLSNIGGTIGKSFEEGLESLRSADIIQETRKLQIRKKGSNMDTKTEVTDANNPQQVQNPEIQLKASRDVRCPMCVAGSHSGTVMHALVD